MLRIAYRALVSLLRLPFFPLWWLARRASRPRAPWVHVRLQRRLVELPHRRRRLLLRLLGLPEALPTALSTLRQLARRASTDPHVEGVVFTLPPLLVGWATASSLRGVLADLRAAGTRVVVHLPEGGSHKELYVASAADRVLLAPEATLICLGLAAEVRSYKGLLDQLGVAVEPFARAEYKTAMEPFAREAMSDAQREQLGALLDTLDGRLRDALGEALRGRGRSDAELAAIFERGFLRGEDAVRYGLADGVCYEDELPLQLRAEGEGPPPKTVRAPRYLGWWEARFLRPLRRPPHVAIVELQGTIAPGRKAERTIAAIRQARKDRRVRGVVLLVSSPGGSALTSDLLHRELVRLREKKPLVAYFADVAASGGYYVGAPAQAIVAQPTTLTGSIGVVSARLLAEDLLARLGIRTEVIRRAPHADMFSPARPLDEAERAILERELDGFYEAFVRIVAEGRGRPAEEIEPLARGRVWSGADAKERGLVDQLGGLDVAIQIVRERLGAGPELRARRLEPPRG
ncbi:MAG TPA: signal peptide peptidase SppA, partial [Polyangiaceae bacterium LLY-WYZ-15_(1-7)]|nr:signal peptide peptidase SppA [Polyangiaceae bacterium LLY-WYZ-15_(1-7)]